LLINSPFDLFLISEFFFPITHDLLHESFLLVFKDVSNVFEDLVHVLVIMIFEGFHGLFSFSFFKVIHFKLVVIEKFEVVFYFYVALFSGFDKFTDSIWGMFMGGAVGVIEGV
jgi:hypothetical protein